MSETELKAIKHLNETIYENGWLNVGDMKILLNLIENSVSKDKIREMKNELNEEFEKNNSSGIYGNDYYIESEKYAFVEEKLNELLEE